MPKDKVTSKQDKSPSQQSGDTSGSEYMLLDKFEVMMTRMLKAMTDSFNQCVSQISRAVEEKINVKLDVHVREQFVLHERINVLEKRCGELQSDNLVLRNELKKQQVCLDKVSTACEDLEQYSRLENVLIHGVPVPQDGTLGHLYTAVPDVLNRFISGLNLTPNMISVTHRLAPAKPSNNSSGHNAPTKPPPVIVRFVHRSTRHNLLANRKELRGKSVVVTEHLTPFRAQLLKKASSLVSDHKILSAWSQDGKILVKTTQNRTVVVTNDRELVQAAQ